VTQALTVAFLGLLGLVGAGALTALSARWAWRYRDRRRARLGAAPRQVLLEYLSGGGAAELEYLVRLPPRVWTAIESNAVRLLGQLSGEARQSLAEVFVRRGAVLRAEQDLARTGPIRRARAAEVLGNVHHVAAVPALCQRLDDRNPDVRLVAARSLGRLSDPAAAPALLRCLAGRRPAPAIVIAQALTRLGPDADRHLIEALAHEHSLVRLTALDAIGLRGVVAAERDVAALLATDASTPVRCRAAGVLGRIGAAGAVAPLIGATAQAQPQPVRVAAAQALGQLGSPSAIGVLVDLMAEPAYQVAHHAAAALARLGRPGEAALSTISRSANAAPSPSGGAAEHAAEAIGQLRLRAGRAPRAAKPVGAR
jgi:HEAT repeat protein